MSKKMSNNQPKEGGCIKVRCLIVILATFCPVICYISRLNLSMTIVAMVEEPDNNTLITSTSTDEFPTDAPTCPRPKSDDISEGPGLTTYGPKYKWDQNDAGAVQAAFFWTYVLCQIPAARIAEMVGAKWVMAIAGLGSAVLSLVTPLAAATHLNVFILVRLLMGVCQTAIYPAGYILYTKWLPPTERSRALPILYVGAYIGSIISSTGAGYLCQVEPGWPIVFYISGGICLIWGIIWILLSASEPRLHKFISVQELDYIETNMEQVSDHNTARKVPSVKKILTNIPVWAMISTFFSANWAFSIVMLLLPTYLNSVLYIPTFQNGLINSSIFALFCVTSPMVGSISTYMIQTRAFGLNRLQIRKLFDGIALYGQSLCFMLLPMMGCNQTYVLALLFVQIALYSLINGGQVQLPSELTLDFTGTIYALANCIGSATGFLVPILHGWIVTDRTNKAEWNTFWYTAAAITALGTTVFMIFGKNNLQDFEKQNKNNQPDNMIDLKQQSHQGKSVLSIT